jgi:hypothetical protein
MADQKTPEELADEAEAKAPAKATKTAKQAPQDMVKLTISPAFNGTLNIDHSEYVVTDGVVEVPPWHVDAARSAGYR